MRHETNLDLIQQLPRRTIHQPLGVLDILLVHGVGNFGNGLLRRVGNLHELLRLHLLHVRLQHDDAILGQTRATTLVDIDRRQLRFERQEDLQQSFSSVGLAFQRIHFDRVGRLRHRVALIGGLALTGQLGRGRLELLNRRRRGSGVGLVLRNASLQGLDGILDACLVGLLVVSHLVQATRGRHTKGADEGSPQ
jgi:hypothetical protein